MKMIDLSGQTFGRWTVVERAPNTPGGQARWLCRCECGGERTLKSIVVRRGLSRSCGCLKLDVLARRSTKHGHSPASGCSPTYSTWAAMVQRCTNPNAEHYADYGGRGITVCGRWMTFANFLADVGEKPPRMSLDRVDNDRGYEPGNCRWATAAGQSTNKRNNHRITFRGETRTVGEWAGFLGIHRKTLSDRLRRGWPVGRALTEPARNL